MMAAELPSVSSMLGSLYHHFLRSSLSALPRSAPEGVLLTPTTVVWDDCLSPLGVVAVRVADLPTNPAYWSGVYLAPLSRRWLNSMPRASGVSGTFCPAVRASRLVKTRS